MTQYMLVAVIAYLLGSIPFGYLLLKIFRKQDVRTIGSGNIGATNVARSGGKGLGLATLILDALKGFIAVVVPRVFAASHLFGFREKFMLGVTDGGEYYMGHSPDVLTFTALAALFAILGHMFPVWLKFKGGKGVATGVGVFLALAPKAVLVVLVIFAAIVAVSRYVSLGSIVASALFPIFFLFMYRSNATPATVLLVCGVAALIIWKHRDNIRRLASGTEHKFGVKHS
jgi:acyl phosphate:glycerol-3-phosphate acyltransferase